jgi:hypothetical protein
MTYLSPSAGCFRLRFSNINLRRADESFHSNAQSSSLGTYFVRR